MSVMLDTETFLMFIQEPKLINARATKEIKSASDRLAISAATVLTLQSRLTLTQFAKVLAKLKSLKPGVRVVPIDLETIALAQDFDGTDEKRLIAATSRQHRLTLIAWDTGYVQPTLNVILAQKLRPEGKANR
jgi:PIN domain nuclease of toxin-antitoxin system